MTNSPEEPGAASEALVNLSDHGTALSVREAAAAARAEMVRKEQELRARADAARDEIAKQKAALEAELARRTAEIEAQMGPLQEQLQQMEEVLWTVNLYLGRDETIERICDGDPAPADTPITIRQKVLVMAEESLLLTDYPGQTGMDYRDIGKFVQWLQQSPDNVERVLPFRKGVTVLIPTRVESRSDNPWVAAAEREVNEASYWLLRNGQQLYLLTVDRELRIFDRILPLRREFVEVFDRRLFGYGRVSGQPVEPGSAEWLELEAHADARRRHYMRIMLVLQGIIDRTTVWAPTFPAGVKLLTLEAQNDGKVVLVQDAEDSIALTDGRESFADYRARLNKLLRPGLRVIGAWPRSSWDTDQEDSRLYPKRAQGLRDDVPHLLEDRKQDGFVFRFKRTDLVWRNDVPVPGEPGYRYVGPHPTEPSQRASYFVRASDPWVLPYDLVTVAELRRFLNSREERSKHFLAMVPTIKNAIAAKDAEAATEAPFRRLLSDQLVNAGADAETVSALLDDLVHWWKLKNTWSRPLNGEPAHEARAVAEILAEYKAREKAREKAAADPALTDRMIAAGRRVPGAICVAQNRQGKWFAYAPSTTWESVFLDITPIGKNGRLGKTTTWKKLAQRSASLLNVAWSTPEWNTWNFSANPRHYLTDAERDGVIAEVRSRAEGLALAVVEYHDPSDPAIRGFASYSWVCATPPEETKVSAQPNPLGHELVEMNPYRVVKDSTGVHLEAGNISRGWRENAFKDHFGGYASDTKWGSTPWWPEGRRQYEPRPRLVWSDEDALDRVSRWREACVDKWRQQVQASQERRRVVEDEAYRYVHLVEVEIMRQLEAQARERFLVDFGRDAEDLWAGHLKSLGLSSPIHPRTIWGVIAQRLDRRDSPVGATLGELARETHERGNTAPGEWHPTPGVQDMHGFEDLTIPPLPSRNDPA